MNWCERWAKANRENRKKLKKKKLKKKAYKKKNYSHWYANSSWPKLSLSNGLAQISQVFTRKLRWECGCADLMMVRSCDRFICKQYKIWISAFIKLWKWSGNGNRKDEKKKNQILISKSIGDYCDELLETVDSNFSHQILPLIWNSQIDV